ncbi:hypothetical protein [Pseudomonas kilonensis]|uniref:hypothetical protein n=1 Tax=Pseudomonas kilonensis TaxID=132476 RepID=UPI001F3A4B40|nr:hypothetical protein [Pseudomonas kilonensis]
MLDLELKDGSVRAVGIYVNDREDARLFRPGYKASVVYALDELKQQPASDGGVNYSKVALEMAVSLQSVIWRKPVFVGSFGAVRADQVFCDVF